MAESRGGEEDAKLKEAYRRVYQEGTRFREVRFFQQVLTSKEVKLKPKSANIAGLQLADLLAYPSKQEILIEKRKIEDTGDKFGKGICKCIQSKYSRNLLDGQISGYGKKFLE